MAITTYKTIESQSVADILLHAMAYEIDILNLGLQAGNFTIRLQDNLPASENVPLKLETE